MIVPKTNKLHYGHIKLPNGLEVLLISDPEADKASAALDVSPVEAPIFVQQSHALCTELRMPHKGLHCQHSTALRYQLLQFVRQALIWLRKYSYRLC